MNAEEPKGDWRAKRDEALKNVKRVLVKVGSAVLTDEYGLNLRVITRLADQIATLHDKGLDLILVTSGAVAAGRTALSAAVNCRQCSLDAKELSGLPAKQAASAIGQSRLMREYDEAFARYGKTTAQVLITREDLEDRDRFLNARHTVTQLLEWRVIPIINENDAVTVAELEFGDNDTLASMVLGLSEADLFVNLTSAAGVFDKNPAEHPGARCLECIPNVADLDVDNMCQGKTATGSGGMHSKLLSAHRAAQLAVPTLIVPGRERFALERALSGADLGTWVMPDETAVSSRKYWLAYHTKPMGSLWVDDGAVNALRNKGKSLLSAGVVRVEGDFPRGGHVRILDYTGQTVGVGVSNYSATDVKKIMGQKSSAIKDILGSGLYTEVVHRDNMLLDPAL